MARRKTIVLLHTGGTLGMDHGRGGPLRPGRFERTLRDQVPELWRIAHIRLEAFSNLDSSQVRPALWSSLAGRVWQALRNTDGVVVTHGTDTLAWTASALSFMLPGLARPVVLTGSQRPLGEIRTDARVNLIDAVTAAESGPPEVTVCFSSRLYRGNRVRKVKINEYDAFDSPNFPPLGTLGVEVLFDRGRKGPRRPARAGLKPRLRERVFLLKLFPGLSPRVVQAILPGIEGLVIEGFGSGNLPMEGEASLLPALEEAAARAIPVVMVSQVPCNAVDLTRYEAGAAAAARGVISGGDMTPEAAVCKLMHVLAYQKDPRRIRALMERDLAGELHRKLDQPAKPKP